MIRAALTALLVASVGATAPAEARKAPPRHQATKGGEAQRRALARQHAAQVRRRAAAQRKALAEATPSTPDVPAAVPEQPTGAPALPTPTGDNSAPVVSAPLARTVGITLREFSVSLTRSTVGAGDVTIQVLNRGEDPHDVRIDALSGVLAWQFAELASLDSTTPTVVPLTPGTYRVFCTLPGHEAAGMKAQLTVAAG